MKKGSDGGPLRVMVGYDGSDDGVRALQYAAATVVANDGELIIIHAIDDTVLRSAWSVLVDEKSYKQAAVRLLTEAVGMAREAGVPDSSIDAEMVMGRPPVALVSLSEEADLVVLGRRATPGAERLYVGSTTLSTAAGSKCPVVMVSAGDEGSDAKGTVGIAVDYAEGSAAPIEWGFREAQERGAHVRAMTVVRRPSSRLFGNREPSDDQRQQVMAEARQRLEHLVSGAQAKVPGVSVDYDVAYGEPAEVLVHASDDLAMLVLGVNPSFATHNVGGIVRAVMTHAKCPVVLVRA